MNELSELPSAPLELAVRIGCKLSYETDLGAPMLLNVKPRHDAYQLVAQEALGITPIHFKQVFFPKMAAMSAPSAPESSKQQ